MVTAMARSAFALILGMSLLLVACAPAASPPPTQPAAQPAAKPAAQPTAQPAAQPAAKPAAQPTAQPAAQPAAPAKQADDWPTKPITIIVPFDAGGSVDRMARGLAPYLSKELNVPVSVENKPGAGGQLGHTFFLQQPDDGSTLLVTPANPYIANNILQTGATFKLSDFAFVNAQWTDWTLIVINKDRPQKTFGEVLDQIKSSPKSISASTTFGSAGHISILVILDLLKIPTDNLNLVTYSGGGPERTAVAGGQVDLGITQAEGSEVIKDMVRPLAVFLDQHNKDWEAPTINEVLAPYGVKAPLLSGSIRVLAAQQSFKQKYPDRWEKLVAAYQRALNLPEYQDWLKTNKMGGDWVGPDKSTQILNDNFSVLEKYKDLIKQ